MHKKYVLVTSLVLLAQVFMSILAPLPLKFMLDYILGDQIPSGPWLWVLNHAKYLGSGNSNQLVAIGVGAYFFTYFLVALFEFLKLFWLSRTSNKIVESTRKTLFKYLTTRNFNFIENQRKADLVGRLSQDTMILQILFETGLPVAIRVLPSFIIIASLMASIHPWFGIVIILLLFLMILGSLLFSELIRKYRRQARDENTMLEQVGLQALQGYALTKSMKLESKYRQKISRYARASSHNIVKAALAEGGLRGTMATIKNISKAMVLFVGGILTVRGEFSIGGIVLFMSYVDTLTLAMKDLIKFSYKAARSYSSLDRIEELLKIGSLLTDPKGGSRALADPIRSVEFKNVQFKYPGETEREVAFQGHFEKGHTYSLMGASGSGKSTILKLMARFFDPSSGTILYNQWSHSELQTGDVRKKIIFVGQENFIISGTVRENLILNSKFSQKDDILWRALEKVNADKIVGRLPKGLDAQIGDGGNPLSTGESQRICLARAFSVPTGTLYIFDEPTAGLDQFSREKVIGSIVELGSPESIVIFTTHYKDEARLAEYTTNMSS